MQTTAETAYRALSHAADEIGRNNFARLPERDRTVATRRKRAHLPARWPTPAHADVTAAMADVMAETITPEDAMALLWRSDIWAERFPK